MRSFDIDEELRRQTLAEAAERAGAVVVYDADVEAYRLVMRAAATPLLEQLPDDFAAGMAAAVAAPEDASSLVERWAPGLGLATITVVGIMTSGELLLDGARQLGEIGAGRLPWPLLCAAALAFAAVALSDRISGLKRG